MMCETGFLYHTCGVCLLFFFTLLERWWIWCENQECTFIHTNCCQNNPFIFVNNINNIYRMMEIHVIRYSNAWPHYSYLLIKWLYSIYFLFYGLDSELISTIWPSMRWCHRIDLRLLAVYATLSSNRSPLIGLLCDDVHMLISDIWSSTQRYQRIDLCFLSVYATMNSNCFLLFFA